MTRGLPIGSCDGFELIVTTSEGNNGEARVCAPDGSMAYLIWVAESQWEFRRVVEPRPTRWGTFAAHAPLSMTTDEEASAFLAAVLPELRKWWNAWKRREAISMR